ncbi:MAG: FAD-binding oxidoreductase, partial [Deltaproteobacteria bacterium]|nr:FAD-binding oxidoreductase [Deltaproteobacteria bacterium]
TVVPPDSFAEFLDYIHALLKTEAIDYLSFGHFGDCHLHFTLLPEQKKLKRAAELYDLFIVKAVELGGVYSGEHGTGKRKRKDFMTLYNQAAIEQLKACKAAVDPDFPINRGNVFIP